MKRFPVLTLLATSLFAMPMLSYAICPFTDYFSINIPASGRIMSEPSVEGNLHYEKQSDTFFTLSCASSTNVSSGDVTMEIGFNEANRCMIVLHDGPYVVNPSVTTVSCIGEVYFNGIDNLMGSHNYTLRFAG